MLQLDADAVSAKMLMRRAGGKMRLKDKINNLKKTTNGLRGSEMKLCIAYRDKQYAWTNEKWCDGQKDHLREKVMTVSYSGYVSWLRRSLHL